MRRPPVEAFSMIVKSSPINRLQLLLALRTALWKVNAGELGCCTFEFYYTASRGIFLKIIRKKSLGKCQDRGGCTHRILWKQWKIQNIITHENSIDSSNNISLKLSWLHYEKSQRWLTFLLRQLDPWGSLAHCDEGHVIVHHGVVILGLQPTQSTEPAQNIIESLNKPIVNFPRKMDCWVPS